MPTAQPDALYQTDPTVGDAARRRIPRFDPGVRGGIPAVADKIVLTPERIAAHPTFAAALNAAIQAVRAPGAVRIPGRPTPYVLTEPIRMRSGVVVRGDGMAQTELHVDIRGDAADVGGSGVRAAVAFEGKAVRTVPLVKAVALAATVVTPDPALFNVADLIGAQLLLTQDNDPADGWNTHAWERRVRGQIVQIKAVKTDKLGVDTPIRLAYPMARKPEATLLGAIAGAGLEDLKLYHDPGSHSGWAVAFWYAANCWLKGVEIELAPDVAVWAWNSRWLTVQGCFIHRARNYGGGKGYGINVNAHSSDCLVTDNTLRALRHSLMVQFGANGNVFSYNYSREPAMSDLSLHGWFPYANLFEGNVASQAYVDNAWGRSGPDNTFFRNRLMAHYADYEARLGIEIDSYADHSVANLEIEKRSDGQVAIGNTLIDGRVNVIDCSDTWVEKNLFLNLPVGSGSGGKIVRFGTVGSLEDRHNFVPGEVVPGASFGVFNPSLYLTRPPSFWPVDRKPWPCIGADVDLRRADRVLSLPAQDRWWQYAAQQALFLVPPRITPAAETVAKRNQPWSAFFVAAVIDRDPKDAIPPDVPLTHLIDWGDGTIETTPPVPAGLIVQRAHSYARAGIMRVRAQSRDLWGNGSEWSAVITVTVL